jgi:diguanylate cyclase (GGDEF)-like protein
MLVDIDHFKKHNDTYGHQEGDHTLRAVAQVIARTCRSTDLAARYGGEEFAVILPASDAQTAYDAAERLRQSVMELPDPKVTISVGVSTFTDSSRTPREMLAAADAALYASKHNGRNQVTLAPAKATPATRVAPMEADPLTASGWQSVPASDAGDASWVPAQAASPVLPLDQAGRPAI